MIYVETEPCHSEGSMEFFRVFADTHAELVALLKTMKLSPALMERGQPNEHVIMAGANTTKIKNATAIDDRGKVKLFLQKTRDAAAPVRAPEPEPETPTEQVVSPTEQVAAPDADVARPRTGRLIIRGKGAQSYNSPAAPSEGPADGDTD